MLLEEIEGYKKYWNTKNYEGTESVSILHFRFYWLIAV